MNHRVRARAKFFFEGDQKFFLKGVTYGTFAPDAEGYYVGPSAKARLDLSMMRDAGVNGVRVYHAPPKWFLDLAIEFGVRVMVTLWWGQNVDFLSSSKRRREIFDKVHLDVKSNAGHPGLLGYLVANEISSTMVRWYGVRRVTEFVENIINVGRDTDDDVMFSYASYPPTEYLLPTNMDFYTFNVYLHRRSEFERYLARLQNLAEDRPLIMGEFGMDTLRHAEEEQAEMLRWHIESVVRGGLAGTFLYTWTDEWWCNGQDITDWAFGLTTRERQPKMALSTVKGLFGDGEPARKVKLPRYPKVSVIVCSYNGAKTLGRCLESLKRLDYPDYEVILVDDGSTDNTQEIAANHPWIVNVRQANSGLSVARNVGAQTASGEVLAYTDSDCMADPEWLYFLVGTLLSGDYAGVGGPNISPPAENWIQACVAAAPGGPNHVLLTDLIAEHIPGCNMAFYKWAFERVGGFDPEYRKAGDDVDFCWRLQQEGQIIGFSPSAIVWHYRRFTLGAFRRQQIGYGEAESLLRFKHLVFFGPTGTAKWKGQIYGAPRFTWLVNRPIIYHGVFGEGLFQSIYPTPQSDVAAYLSSIEWVVLTLFVFCLSIPLPVLRIVPYLMFGGTFLVALSYMIHAKLEPKHDTIRARLLVAFLALTQPLVRGWSRYFTWLRFKRTPPAVIASPEKNYTPTRGSISSFNFWTENGQGREHLLPEIIRALDAEGWNYSMDTGWKEWDIQIYGSLWWGIKLRSVTEYHGGPKCLTRIKLDTHTVATTFLFNLVLLAILSYRQFFVEGGDLWLWIPYIIWLAILARRAYRLKKRVAELVDASAQRCGFVRIGKGTTPQKA
ncbi:MAG TPA: glycosyltransferase [Terrimicrobiaceae bacterium]|nr:glycosyltransferase [Terrimicrobiaceae bacterium]